MALEEFIEKCAEWGLEGTELTEYYFKKPLTPEYILGIKHKARRNGLDITSTPIGNRFAQPPGEARDREIARVKDWIDVAATLGSPVVRIFAGGVPKGGDPKEARKWVVECIHLALEHAAKRGIFLALENDGGLTDDAAGTLEIVRAIEHPWFGMNLDMGNFHSADPYAELETLASYAITTHVKSEINRQGKKEPMDFGRIVGMLRKANYHGYLSLEYEGGEDPMVAVPRHLEALRKAIG
jgi:sugar phosphate isomerase/epimerase